MKNFLSIAAAVTLSFATTALFAGERVGDFSLIDHEGTFHNMAWYDDQSAVLLLPQSVAVANPMELESFLNLKLEYQDKGIIFFLLNSGEGDRGRIQADSTINESGLKVLMDDTQLVTELLGITRLDQVVLYNPKTFELLYRGPVNDELDISIEALLAGVENQFVDIETTGAAIEFDNVNEHGMLSYVNDIAPIIAENCAECHREGGVAPFAMDSSLAVQGWSPMIREVVLTKRMPPGQIDNKVGHKIKNEMNLGDENTQKLVRWINSGSPIDGNHDPLTELSWPTEKWSLGVPDLIVQIPPQSVPATGVVDYIDVEVDLGLEQDRWIRGSEVSPGDSSVLHHIVTTVVAPNSTQDFQAILMDQLSELPEERAQEIRTLLFAAVASGEGVNIETLFSRFPEIDVAPFLTNRGGEDQASVAGYAPGNSVNLSPEGVGGLLKAGTQLKFQMHYTTSGRETVDATEVAIYFFPEDEIPAERMSGSVGNSFSVAIPAEAKDHEMEMITEVPNDAELYSFLPHMHFRGKRMKFVARYPDGSEEMLLNIPAYSFNWQLRHELETPLRVPAGTQLIATGAFDNSSQNPFNPDPNAEVTWGEQSWQEMFMGFYQWKNVEEDGSE